MGLRPVAADTPLNPSPFPSLCYPRPLSLYILFNHLHSLRRAFLISSLNTLSLSSPVKVA